jgi:hypothetical protein
MLCLECEANGGERLPMPLRANLGYCKKYDPGTYVDLVETYPEEAAKFGCSIPPEARKLEDIFQEVGHHKFRVLNVITLNSYLVTGGVQYGTGPVEGIIFWNAVYIDTFWKTGNGCKTYAQGGKRMYVLLSTPEEIEGFKHEELDLALNETQTICT